MSHTRWMLAVTSATIALAQPAWADGWTSVRAVDLERVNEIALREGLLVRDIEVPGPGRLTVVSEGRLSRSAFLKRTSLVAYLVFDRLRLPLEEITFRNTHDGSSQSVVIRAEDHALYLQDRIGKDEYERRLSYRETSPSAAVAKRPAPAPRQAQVVAKAASAPAPRRVQTAASAASAPALRQVQMAAGAESPIEPLRAEIVRVPRPAPIRLKPTPVAEAAPLAKPGAAPIFGLAYWLGGSGRAYDAYQLEYGHPLMPLLDLRPSLQLISPLSPANMSAGDAALSGFSLACDFLGTTRQAPAASGLSFDGGLGARLSALHQGASGGAWWPSAHMRVGVRWHAMAVSMRFPIFRRAGDPTAGWESSIGFSWPLGS